MTICDTVQRQLAEAGVEAADIEEIARHLEGCDDCSKFLADLRTIDAGLIELTSDDAPDALVAATLAAVRAADEPKAAPARPGQRQRWLAGGLAGGAVIAASVALTLNLFDPASYYSSQVADKSVLRDAVDRDGSEGDGRYFGFQGQQAASPTARNAEQVLSASESRPANGPAVEGQLRAQKSAQTDDFRARSDNSRGYANERLSNETAQTKAPESAETGAAALRELDVIARVAPQDLLHRRAGRTGLERRFRETADQENFEYRSESSRGDDPNALPVSAVPTQVGGKAKFDDDGRLGAEFEPGRLRMPPESDVSRSRTSSDLSELNKDTPAKNSLSEDVPKQKIVLGLELGSGAASGDIVRGKPAEQLASSLKPAEQVEDEKKNRANIVAAGPKPDDFFRYFQHELENAQSVSRKVELRAIILQQMENAQSESTKGELREIISRLEEGVAFDSGRAAPAEDAGRAVGGVYTGGLSGLSDAPARKSEIAVDQLTPADRFLLAQRSLDDLLFQEPTGYWANTYIPGDPAIRLLQARLAAWDRTILGQYNRLEQDVRPGLQPFDAPADAAVAVTMASDATAIDGPTRLRVQIGLKGAERLGGRRPAMNIGLVVDLRSLADAETGSRIRALITALERSRQPGDRFSLTVAGPAGGLLVAPEQFRHGPLRVALARMFDTANVAGEAISLPLAMNLASENVRAGDNPESVLGSSLVMLVTGASLAGDVDTLERMAHDNAVSGVPLSVVSLAGRDDLAHIDRLVAAGQGNRRILDTAQAADGLVDRELHAASRAVARALRLRIRLAPGVKLVSVLDSRRLGEPQAAQVREAEVAIDQRLARNLGIEADRGDDEQGIQMVIPNFFAGDSHVVLLDVVADRPGPIADVTVRYKDVVNLKNGVAQASLALDDAPREAGPLERNVLKNLVAVEFAKQTRLASRQLALGNFAQARQRIIELRDFVQGMRFAVPGWRSDPDLAADEAVLTNYASVFTVLPANDPALRQLLADSLRVAAHRKLQPEVPR